MDTELCEPMDPKHPDRWRAWCACETVKKKLNNVQRQVTGLWLDCERWHSDEDETDSPSDEKDDPN